MKGRAPLVTSQLPTMPSHAHAPKPHSVSGGGHVGTEAGGRSVGHPRPSRPGTPERIRQNLYRSLGTRPNQEEVVVGPRAAGRKAAAQHPRACKSKEGRVPRGVRRMGGHAGHDGSARAKGEEGGRRRPLASAPGTAAAGARVSAPQEPAKVRVGGEERSGAAAARGGRERVGDEQRTLGRARWKVELVRTCVRTCVTSCVCSERRKGSAGGVSGGVGRARLVAP